MQRERIEQAAHELASRFPTVPPADWSAIVDEAVTLGTEAEKLEELPLMNVEPIFVDLCRRLHETS